MGNEVAESRLLELEGLYRHLHAHPELSFAESKTASRMAAEWRAAGFEVTEGVGGFGVAAVLRNGEGPLVMLRTDLDALPVSEQTGVPFASAVRAKDKSGADVSVMHACGHDMHMTVATGTARALSEARDSWSGTILLIGQPAEEKGFGARAMLKDGLFRRFGRPDFALAFHVAADLPSGTIGVAPGPALASVDSVDVTVRGIGGHGAYPHHCKDPIVLAANLVTSLQTLVSREVPPFESAVVTVGSIHGGSKHNIIPDEVTLQITVRAYTEQVRRRLLDGIRRMAEQLARAAGLPDERLPIVHVLDESIPATINDPDLTERAGRAARGVLGDAAVTRRPPVMGGEDFGLFGREDPAVPICLLWLGAVDPAVHAKALSESRPLPSLHSPEFIPATRPTLATGIKVMTAVVRDLLPPTA